MEALKIECEGRLLGVWTNEEDFKKAKEIFDKYPNSFRHFSSIMQKYSDKLKRLHDSRRERGWNEAEVRLADEYERSFIMFEKYISDAFDGKPAEIFVKVNNLK